MKVEDRPYAGNWSLDFQNKYRTVRSWTPDAIVQFNGDTTVPGCMECKNRIDFSAFINSVNCSAGVGSGDASCDISLVIPKAYGDSVYKDGKFILTTGIEVNVFYRGFFTSDKLTVSNDIFEVEVEDRIGNRRVEKIHLDKVKARPYYPVFHGIISGVSIGYNDNSYSVSISTRNMLSFWDNQMINTQQGFFAAQPKEARGSINYNGHVYTNMTPHQIIYDLYLDSGGSPEGTGFVYQKKSNLRAATRTGQQFFSLYLRFLENRFENGLYGLKMFGASGRMYTGLEQSILVDTTPYGKDNEYKKLVKEQLKNHTKAKKDASSALSNMVKAGVVAYNEEGKLQRTMDVRLTAQISEKDSMGVNALAVKEFIPDLGSLVQVAFMESNFESKMGIANRVAEKVGYEFYQDFDGDLVFKPPMYNMDTSSSRVHQILREDTLSIDYSHAEPEYTYVVCTGGPFRNLKTSFDNSEWGVTGMYVDYKLVAKYGWKVLEFQSSIYNDARKAHYAAVVALDSANKNTEGASVSIPLRPELRPGYPIYLEENDCFYYVESVSHTFSFGGECTTSLTLTCQRKKFIPPGNPETPYSVNPERSVDLSDPSLPEKFLYKKYTRTTDFNEQIELSKICGFPNVVMALDPYSMDPGFLHFSLDYQAMGGHNSKTREAYRRMLLVEAKRLKILRQSNGSNSIFEGPWELNIDGKVFPLKTESSDTRVNTTKTGKILSRRPKIGSADAKKMIMGETAMEKASIMKRKAEEKAAKAAGKAKTASRVTNNQTQRTVEEYFDQIMSGSPNEYTILDLIKEIRKHRNIPDPKDSTKNTSNILRLLEDKKSSFAPHLPGYYRYYSSSHPTPRHQGPDIISFVLGANKYPQLQYDDGELVPDQTDHNMVESLDKDVVEFINKPQTVRGIYTRTLYSDDFEYKATKDIKTLAFQVNGTIVEDTITNYNYSTNKWEKNGNYGSSFWATVQRSLFSYLKKKIKPTTTVGQLKKAVMQRKPPAGYPKNLFFGDTELTNLSAKIVDVASNTNTTFIANALSRATVSKAKAQSLKNFGGLYQKFQGTNKQKRKFIIQLINEVRKTFRRNGFVGRWRTKGSSKKVVKWKKGEMYSPVFPVSDEIGYEVFGSYQYGRGLDIARGGVFDVLLRQDPTKMLSEQQLKELRDSLATSTQEEFNNKLRANYVEVIRKLAENGDYETINRIRVGLGLTKQTDKGKVIDYKGINSDDPLINALMTKSDEQVITNIPKALAEIVPDTRNEAMCTCRNKNTDVVLLSQSLDLTNVVEIENPVVRGVRNEAERKAFDWQEHQTALRGRVEFNGNIRRERLSDNQDSFEEGFQRASESLEALGESFDALGEDLSNIGETDIERAERVRQARINTSNGDEE